MLFMCNSFLDEFIGMTALRPSQPDNGWKGREWAVQWTVLKIRLCPAKFIGLMLRYKFLRRGAIQIIPHIGA
ncbi:hypothetical protein ABD76_03820 [Paenibacillus dendritiformis]|nr:hypothetical protein [Paenibacillus dendritiformis]